MAACQVELVQQRSNFAKCTSGVSFGCEADGRMWVEKGCREAPPKMLKNRETHVAEPAQVFRYQHSPRWHAEELQFPDGRAPAETLRWGVREH